MNLPDIQPNRGMFSGTGICELCDSIKDIHRILKSMEELFVELESAEAPGANGLQLDFKKWGIRTITDDLLTRQYEKIDRIMEIYKAGQERLKGK